MSLEVSSGWYHKDTENSVRPFRKAVFAVVKN